MSRQCIYSHNNELCRSLDSLLVRDSNRFWKALRSRKKNRVRTTVDPGIFVDYYSELMQENSTFSPGQTNVVDCVITKYSEICDTVLPQTISGNNIDQCLAKLKRNSSPGIDGIAAEFLLYGRSAALTKHLVSLYSTILKYNVVPKVFSTGVMVPVLKKPTLDPSKACNYRPITVSSVFSKLFEIMIVPEDVDVPLCDNQFGFRAKL